MPTSHSADHTRIDSPHRVPSDIPLGVNLDRPSIGEASNAHATSRVESQHADTSLADTPLADTSGQGEEWQHVLPGRYTESWLTERFEILEKLGQGGMGQVYRAFDPRLQRFVALKLPLGSLSEAPADRERFLREGRAAAVVKHPNVVSVYEICNSGEQYCIVCEYVAGPTLKTWLSEQDEPLPPRTAAQLLRNLASGLRAAHEKGVFHRDMKPANVLLERCSGEPSVLGDANDSASSSKHNDYFVHAGNFYRPRITDFGLAAFDGQVTQLTRTGCMLGTAAYMSPEQAEGRPATSQTDVFALGIILYEVLCKRSPYGAETYAATIDRIRNHEPPRPSRVQPGVPGDLSAICECALSKDVMSRYSTVADMEADLSRFLAGVPVHARTIGPIGKLSRWSKRNPLAATLAMLVCFALVLTLWQNLRLAESLDTSEALRERADSVTSRLSETNAKYRQEVYVQDMILAFDAWEDRESTLVEQILAKHVPRTEADELRGFEWTLLDRLCKLPAPFAFEGHEGEAFDVAVVPGGKEFFSTGADRLSKRWSVTEPKPLMAFPSVFEFVRALAISPNGQEWFSGSNFLHGRYVEHGNISRWLPISNHRVGIRAIDVSPDESLIASTSFHTDLQIKSLVRDQEYVYTDVAVPTPDCRRICFSPDGRYLYFSCISDDLPGGTSVGVWNVLQREVERRIECLDRAAAASVDVSGNGKYLAVAASSEVQVLDTQSGEWLARTPPHRGRVLDVEFAPCGRRFACATQDGSLAVYEFTPEARKDLVSRLIAVREFPNALNSLAWINDTQVVSADEMGRVRLHTFPETDRNLATFNDHDLRFLDHGRLLLCRDSLGRLQIIDAADPTKATLLDGCDLPNVDQADAVLKEGLLALCHETEISLWDITTGKKVNEFSHRFLVPQFSGRSNSVTGLSFSSDASRLASIGTADHSVQIWNTRTGQQEQVLRLNENGYTVSFSPDDRYLLYSGNSCAVLHEFATGSSRPIEIRRLWLSHWLANDRVLLAGQDHQLGVCDASSGKVLERLDGQSELTYHVEVSPDQQTLVTSSGQALFFWHLASRRLIGEIGLELVDMAFLPDGSDLQVLVRDRESPSQVNWQTLSTDFEVASQSLLGTKD